MFNRRDLTLGVVQVLLRAHFSFGRHGLAGASRTKGKDDRPAAWEKQAKCWGKNMRLLTLDTCQCDKINPSHRVLWEWGNQIMLWLIMHRMMNRCFPSPLRSQQVGRLCSVKKGNSVSATSCLSASPTEADCPGRGTTCILSQHHRGFTQRRLTDHIYVNSAHELSWRAF